MTSRIRLPFLIPALLALIASVTFSPSAAAATVQPLADCSALADAWLSAHPTKSDQKLIVFNRAAQVCAIPQQTFTQGDVLIVGIAVQKGEPVGNFPRAQFAPCSLRPVLPVINGNSTQLPGPAGAAPAPPTYAQDAIIEVGRQFCFDDAVTITVQVQNTPDPLQTGTTSIAQYKRYQASVQLGVLYSDVHERNFALHDVNGQSLIYSSGPDNRGPEYTASVLLHGLPHYFKQGIGYKGRDLINDNDFSDRVGLVLSAGLKDPGDRFGLGLSFELVRGINLVVVHEWVKVKQLEGLKIGDPFTGAADTIPTSKTWDKSTSFGVSFDVSYVTQLFTRK